MQVRIDDAAAALVRAWAEEHDVSFASAASTLITREGMRRATRDLDQPTALVGTTRRTLRRPAR